MRRGPTRRETIRGLTPSGRDAVVSRLLAETRRLREAAGRPYATLLITIDQAEQIAGASGDAADAFGDYLRASTAPEANARLLLAARAEHFGELQRHPRFDGIEAQVYDLRGLAVDRWGPVVENPAQRCGLELDASLVEALKADAPAPDGLAPLAFALQRLWWKFSAEGSITVDDYRSTSALPGLIESVADRALFGPPGRDAEPDPSLDALGAHTFVPALVDVAEAGQTRIRTAPWSGFDDDQRALLERFVSARLVHRVDDDRVELAHEAVVGHWPRLQGWLEAERERQSAFRALQSAAWVWSDTGQDEQIAHRGPSLQAAVALRDDPRFGDALTAVERAYLDACAELERPAEPAPRDDRRTTAIAVLMLVVAVGAAAIFGDPWTRKWWANAPWSAARSSKAVDVTQQTLGPRSAYVASDITPFVLAESAEAGLIPGDRFRECKRDCPEMVVVPSGAFEMGDDRGEWAFAQPVHVVTIDRVFAVSTTEVTFAMWAACVSDGACRDVDDSGWGQGRRPVINVSIADAEAYVRWLGHATGRPYRLLTEAEWEYAARAATDGAYWWGESVGLARANCRDCGTEFDGVRTATVASFSANGFGLYDVHGNVWEWVVDCWHADYESAPGDGSAWKLNDNGDCSKAVIRGGSWEASFNVIRAASRDWYSRSDSSPGIGFRIARGLAR